MSRKDKGEPLLDQVRTQERKRLQEAGCRPAEGFLTWHWNCPDGCTRSQDDALNWLDQKEKKTE